jgi:hypothetical protein
MQTYIMKEWKTSSKLGVANSKVQAMKPDDTEVPGYLWDMCDLGLWRSLEDVDNGLLDRIRGIILVWWKGHFMKGLSVGAFGEISN